MEIAYQEFVFSGNMVAFRLMNLMVIIGMVLFLAIDLFRQVDYSAVFASRVTSLVIASVLLTVCTPRRVTALQIEAAILISIAHILLFAFVTSSVANMPPFFLTNIMITVLVLTPTVSGLRLRWSIPLSVGFFLSFLVYSQFVRPEEFYVSQYPNLITVLIYCLLAGIVVEARRRKSFLQYQDLSHQKELIDQLHEQKSKIISIISHDVASPLNSLSGLLKLQSQGHIKAEELPPLISEIDRRLDSVSSLLQSIVRWSRSQMDGYVPIRKPLEWKDVLGDIVRLFERQASEKGIKILTPSATGIQSVVDRDMLELVLRNLVSNAIKFSPVNGVVEMNLSKSVEGVVLFKISNQGDPLPEEQKDKLFTYQVHSMPGSVGEKGTGLGLAMSAYFMKINRGRIYLDQSRKDRITFCLELLPD